MRRPLLLIGLALLFLSATVSTATAQDDHVLLVAIDGVITPSTFDLVSEAIAVAEVDGARAIVLKLNTPGGGVAETLDIVNALTTTSIPVLGYVSPSGGSAVSAGTFLLVSTDLAGMAPFSTIGSVQPVVVGPTGLQPVTDPKTINFLVTNLAANLAKHGRNTSLAHEFVVNNLNLEASQAVRHGATEIVAESLEDLLAQADGRTTVFKGVTLDLAGARVVEFSPSLGLSIRNFISNPLISGLLLIIGLYAIIFGVASPGVGAEVFGVIVLIIALIGLGLDIDPLAIILILIGVVFLLAEIYTPGFGVFGVGGIIAVVLGTILLAPIRPPDFVVAADYQVTLIILLLVPTAAFGAFLLFAMYKVLQVRRRPPVLRGLIGQEAQTQDAIGPETEGYVRYEAELWKATAAEEIGADETVFIHSRDGPVLTVAREPPVTLEAKVPFWRRLIPQWRPGP